MTLKQLSLVNREAGYQGTVQEAKNMIRSYYEVRC